MTHCISQTYVYGCRATYSIMANLPEENWLSSSDVIDFFVFICVSFKTNIYPISNQIMFCVICYLDVRILFIQNSSFNTFWHLTSDTYLS